MPTAHSKHVAKIHLDATNFPLIFSTLCQYKPAAGRVLLCVSPDLESVDFYRQIPPHHT